MGSCKRDFDRSGETAVSDRKISIMLVSAGSAAYFGSVPCRKQGIERGMAVALDTGQTVHKRCKKEDRKWKAGLCGLLFLSKKNEKEQSYDERKKEKAAGWDTGTSS